jgi:light-regulated signal transduction histidine kinase (bacteriophytochrome)
MVGVESRLTDLDSCAREPIHIIGHIQSHGMLFALSEPRYDGMLIVLSVIAKLQTIAVRGVASSNVLPSRTR